MAWRDRIVGLERVEARTLRPHPDNYRLHPALQRGALTAAVAAIGFVAPIVARRCPDGGLQILDGHLRADLEPGAVVPVVVLDVSEAEGVALLAHFDPLGRMAGADDLALQALRERLPALAGGLADFVRALARPPGAWYPGLELAPGPARATGSLVARFLAPPFSVLDPTQDYWVARRAGWTAAGIGAGARVDPVLAEILLQWFAPAGGRVWHPAAPATVVWGVVAAQRGFHYRAACADPAPVAAEAAGLLGATGDLPGSAAWSADIARGPAADVLLWTPEGDDGSALAGILPDLRDTATVLVLVPGTAAGRREGERARALVEARGFRYWNEAVARRLPAAWGPAGSDGLAVAHDWLTVHVRGAAGTRPAAA